MNAKKFKRLIQSRKVNIHVYDQMVDENGTTHIKCKVFYGKR